MSKYIMSVKKYFIFALFFFFACTTKLEDIVNPSIDIEWIIADYNQVENTLFLQIDVLNSDKNYDSIIVELNSENYDLRLLLNDKGENGDIIANNNIYSINANIDLPYTTISLNAILFIDSNNKVEKNKIIFIEEQFAPEIVDVKFWQINADGSKSIFNPNNEPFQVHEEEYKYLYFQLIVNDKNGLDDIQYLKYQINVENMIAEDSCNYTPPAGFLSYPQWYLEYQETNIDGDFVFDIKNQFLDNPNTEIEEPGLEYKPIKQCGRIGVAIFRFIISDMTFEPILKEVSVGFDK